LCTLFVVHLLFITIKDSKDLDTLQIPNPQKYNR
jgi:hypothetical protein